MRPGTMLSPSLASTAKVPPILMQAVYDVMPNVYRPAMQLQVVYMPKVYILQAARYDTWLLVLLLPKGVVSSFLFLHFARRIMKQAGMTVVQSKLLTARGNGHCGIQQLITRMQTLAAGVGGSNLAWCKPAECELWSADQPTSEARKPVGSEDSVSTAGRTFKCQQMYVQTNI